jgi:hypothetical protein
MLSFTAKRMVTKALVEMRYEPEAFIGGRIVLG